MLLANDVDPGASDVLSIESVQSVSESGAGVTINSSGHIVYDPSISASLAGLKQGESIVDRFTYVVTDDAGATSVATVTVTVNGSNDSPVARPDSVGIVEGQTTAVSGNLLSTIWIRMRIRRHGD